MLSFGVCSGLVAMVLVFLQLHNADWFRVYLHSDATGVTMETSSDQEDKTLGTDTVTLDSLPPCLHL